MILSHKFLLLQNKRIPASETLTQCIRERKRGILSTLLISHPYINTFPGRTVVTSTVTFGQILLT